MSGTRVLYISYDGMTDPLGQSQVLPYLRGLARLGHAITILSCEKPDRMKVESETIARICAEAGFDWRPIAYHRRPPVLSSIVDLAALKRHAFRLHEQKPFELVHCRSYIPALVGRAMKRKFKTRFLFDMRGFWADERSEGGSWNLRNPLFRAIYHYFKRREAEFLRSADHIVSLTRNAEREIRRGAHGGAGLAPISVIPCCVDFDHFDPRGGEARRVGRAMLGLDAQRPVLAYVGSLGGNYMLDEMLDFFVAYRARMPGASFLFVTQGDSAPIVAAAADKGISGDALIIRAGRREDMPALIAAADLGLAFKQPSFSAMACSPTKVGEMLAMGVPVVVNSGVGDVAEVIAATGGGATIDRFDGQAYAAAVEAVEIRRSPTEIRDAARQWFDLEDGVRRYDAIYRDAEGAS